jgi:hypothetical protein
MKKYPHPLSFVLVCKNIYFLLFLRELLPRYLSMVFNDILSNDINVATNYVGLLNLSAWEETYSSKVGNTNNDRYLYSYIASKYAYIKRLGGFNARGSNGCFRTILSSQLTNKEVECLITLFRQC